MSQDQQFFSEETHFYQTILDRGSRQWSFSGATQSHYPVTNEKSLMGDPQIHICCQTVDNCKREINKTWNQRFYWPSTSRENEVRVSPGSFTRAICQERAKTDRDWYSSIMSTSMAKRIRRQPTVGRRAVAKILEDAINASTTSSVTFHIYQFFQTSYIVQYVHAHYNSSYEKVPMIGTICL